MKPNISLTLGLVAVTIVFFFSVAARTQPYKAHLITLTKPKVRPEWMMIEQYESALDTLDIRKLEVGGKMLVTTMTCTNTTSKSALKDLYKRRWQVELDIRNIKTTLGMEP